MKTEDRTAYPEFAPKVPRTWWLRTGPYRRFAAREFTSLFAGAFSLILLLFLLALSGGRGAYEGFLQWLELPAVMALSVVILAAVVYHAATWFRLTAHILVIRLGRTVVPRSVVTGVLAGVWILVSAIVAYLHVWF